MAPATPSGALPRSNFHHSIASASDGNPVSAAPPPYEAVPHEDLDPAGQASSFSHPEHAIPPRRYEGVKELVIVCCHAIFHPDASSPSFPLCHPYDESNWHLAPFQKSNPQTGKPGEHETFLAHVSAGLDALTIGESPDPYAPPTSILVLSGGVTKSSLTSLSEARSYYHAALAHALSQGHWNGGLPRELFDKGRILLEEQATDSFQNLLFSILLFRRTTGFYPKHIRIITHAFKTKRFLRLHGPAIRWPRNKLSVQGIDPVMSSAEYEDAIRGEERYGYAPWQDDALGMGEVLGRKRRQRGWVEEKAAELGNGLEENVRQLLNGTVAETLPWTEPRDTTAGRPRTFSG